METTLFNAASAAALGYPATLHGFTPDARDYWYEPHLPFMTQRELDEWRTSPRNTNLSILEVKGEGMAPRYPVGTRLVVDRLTKYQQICGGVYFWQWRDQRRGVLQTAFGRLKKMCDRHLVLVQDLDGKEMECPLHWKDEGFALYLVDYYVAIPGR